jgi:hypothetical protein
VLKIDTSPAWFLDASHDCLQSSCIRVESMLGDVLETILEWLLTLKVSRNRANRLVCCVALFLQFKLFLPHIEHRANCNHHRIFLGQSLLIFWMIRELEESISGFETVSESPLKMLNSFVKYQSIHWCWHWKAILTKKKKLHIQPYHHGIIKTVIGPIIWKYFNVHPFRQGDFVKAPLE